MNIKENIDVEVLKTVSESMNVSEDLLIQMISSDLYMDAIMVLSVAMGVVIIGIVLAILGYIKGKKEDYDSDFAGGMIIVSGFLLLFSLMVCIGNLGYKDYFEILFNHEYSVVKEINRMVSK